MQYQTSPITFHMDKAPPILSMDLEMRYVLTRISKCHKANSPNEQPRTETDKPEESFCFGLSSTDIWGLRKLIADEDAVGEVHDEESSAARRCKYDCRLFRLTLGDPLTSRRALVRFVQD